MGSYHVVGYVAETVHDVPAIPADPLFLVDDGCSEGASLDYAFYDDEFLVVAVSDLSDEFRDALPFFRDSR